jgi:hypothetical protein
MRRPFTLYKEKTKSGTFWYARFWDESVQKYAHSRSTGIPVEGKKERRREAEEAARAFLVGMPAWTSFASVFASTGEAAPASVPSTSDRASPSPLNRN